MKTESDHIELYSELKEILYTKGINISNLTVAQYYFVEGLELAGLGVSFLKSYAELIDRKPDIELRSLHAFCMGYGIGSNGDVPELKLNKTYQ